MVQLIKVESTMLNNMIALFHHSILKYIQVGITIGEVVMIGMLQIFHLILNSICQSTIVSVFI